MRMPDADFNTARLERRIMKLCNWYATVRSGSSRDLAHGLLYQHIHIVPSVIYVDAGHKIQERVSWRS
jgi:hypothetical protein